jgi:large subunit ribosomal protein L9
MKVVFMEEVEGTARVGEVKNVADGFARNYLLPRRLAAPATDHYVAIAQARAEKESRRQDRLDDEARVHLLPKMEGRSVTIEVRVGEQGKLFGSVTSRDIAELLQAETGIELEHKQVDLRQPIRDLGAHEVVVKLTRNVHMAVTVNVEPLGGMAEGAAAEGEAVEAEVEEAEVEEAEAVVEEPEAEAVAEEEAAVEEPEAEAEAEPAVEEAEAVAEEEPEEEEPEAVEAEAEEPAEEEEPAAEEPEAKAVVAEETAAEEPEAEAMAAEEPAVEEPEAVVEEEAAAEEPEAEAAVEETETEAVEGGEEES